MTGIEFFQTDISPKDGRICISESSSLSIKYPQLQTTNSETSLPIEEFPAGCEDFGSQKEFVFNESSELPSHNNISPFHGSTSNVLGSEALNFEDLNTFNFLPPESFEKTITESPIFPKPLLKHPMNSQPANTTISKLQFQLLQDQSPKDMNFANVDLQETQIYSADSRKFSKFPEEIQTQNLSMETTTFQGLKNSEEFCLKLIPRINKVTPQNYGELLVDVLRGLLRDIPLEEFYELLHNSTAAFPCENKPVSPIKMKVKQEGLKICSFIIVIFGLFYLTSSSELFNSLNNELFKAVNFHKFIQTFLATKIIFDLFEEVDSCPRRSNAIPRKLIYKAYCFICKKLSQNYTAVSNFPEILGNVVLGQSQLGRIMRLVYPNLKTCRLGRRGSSEYHYLGLTWNRSIIDDKILEMIELENSDTLRCQVMPNEKKNDGKSHMDETLGRTNEMTGNEYGNKKPLYSFIRISTTMPEIGCPPRSWEYFSGKMPQPSSWSQKVIARSTNALRKYNIDMESFIENFEKYIFAAVDLNFLFDNFVERLKTLTDSNSEDAAYLSLYLSVLLSLFPIIIASDEEVQWEAKVQLRKNLASFNHQLTGFAKQKSDHLTNFSHIIRKMIYISEMTLSCVPSNLVEGITNEIVMDLLRSTDTQVSVCGTANEEIILDAVILASKAYGPEFFCNNRNLTAEDNNEIIMGISKSFCEFSNATTRSLKEECGLLRSKYLEGKKYDLPFQIFKTWVRFFHEICLSNPFVSKLPIQVIKLIAFKMNKEIQNLSFSNFFNRDPQISKETFKTWWVHSALAEEYMQVFAEIVAMIDYYPNLYVVT